MFEHDRLGINARIAPSLYIKRGKKAGKFGRLGLIWTSKAMRLTSLVKRRRVAAQDFDSSVQGKNMGVTGKESKPPSKDNDKPKESAPKRVEVDDDEDGDIATPKRDRYGEDDEPL